MFWWLSFLRPPPVAVAVDVGVGSNSAVEFIPQITDDLRSEPYPHPIDVYFTWTTPEFRHFTEPKKLTTYRPENAHKLVAAPVPVLHQTENTPWIIGLFTLADGGDNDDECYRDDGIPHPSAMYIRLADSRSLTRILPVFSSPITFTTKSRNNKSIAKPQKQDEIQRIYTVPILDLIPDEARIGTVGKDNENQRSLIIFEKTSPDLDKKVWDSGLSCSSWLAREANRRYGSKKFPIESVEMSPEMDAIADVLFKPGCKLLELGTGSGIVSVVLSTLLKPVDHPPCQGHHDLDLRPKLDASTTRIHATDLPSALPLIGRNMQMNCHPDKSPEKDDGPPFRLKTTAGILDWEEDDLPHDVISQPWEVIIMSDVTYNTSSFPALLKTLRALLTRTPSAWVVLAYKERHPSEREAWGLFENELRLRFVLAEEFQGAHDGAKTEIWLGRVENV